MRVLSSLSHRHPYLHGYARRYFLLCFKHFIAFLQAAII
uniref:Uncharacterized protein n=1 Tax=Ascaris lumbricoides TaxID=6252 RepID=A0A0M3HKE6_ASCLU